MRAIETEYKGYRFRSRLEARWAVFFDACGVRWEYEPEGFDLGNGQMYLPDFLLHGVSGRASGDLYVEVKGKMTVSDATKIYTFSGCRNRNEDKNPILVVAGIPDGNTIGDIEEYCREWGYSGFPDTKGGPYPFNFETIDGDYFVAHPGINKKGCFELFGDDSGYTGNRDDNATLRAFRLARQARFEHGERPYVRRYRNA
ncbi:MAG: hypothetical protein IJ521_02420 [Schwartzia sp.]|nr:hypothetical protein [Schwartzia sp. (in: firmicutes)]